MIPSDSNPMHMAGEWGQKNGVQIGDLPETFFCLHSPAIETFVVWIRVDHHSQLLVSSVGPGPGYGLSLGKKPDARKVRP